MNKMRQSITYYMEKGKHNTRDVLELSKARALELGIKHVVVATSHAFTPVMAAEVFEGTDIELIAVGLSASFREHAWDMTEEETAKVLACGVKVVKNMHAFSAGVEEAFYGGKALQHVVGDTLSIICQGMKVSVEVAIMAAEAGFIPVDKEIISISGTDGGADTSIVMLPNYARKFKKIEVLEILCKPRTPFK